MSTTDRHARNDRILALRARGLTQREIAARVGLTERQVRRVLSERSRARVPSRAETRSSSASAEPTSALIDELEEVVGELAAMATAYAGPGSRHAAIEATRSRVRADAAIAGLRARAPELAAACDMGTLADMSGHGVSGSRARARADPEEDDEP